MKKDYIFYSKQGFLFFLFFLGLLLSPMISKASSQQIQDDQNGDWTAQHVVLYNTPEAAMMVRAGDIDNLGFGWPDNFNPFSGASTPAHAFPWTPNDADASGTDRIMVVSSYNGNPPNGMDGYTSTTTRPSNLPRPIVLHYDLQGVPVHSAVMQIFVDDFQAPVWGTKYFVTLNGKSFPAMAKIINSLNQTGPIGKLINVQIPGEYFYLIQQDSLSLYIDDTTTGAGDGYAIDFVKLLVNLKQYEYTAQVYGKITDTTGTPLEGALAYVSGVDTTYSDANGFYNLKNLPAGTNRIVVTKPTYDTVSVLLNLVSGDSLQQDFILKRSKVIVSTTTGGYWKEVTTWIGGVVPTENDDVIIDGNVILDGYGHKCNNLTIHSGDTLYNISTSSNNLKIYGDILNDGVVMTTSDYTFYPYKNITNNGTWNTYKVSLEYGTTDEKIEINGPFTFSPFISINANVDGASSHQWYRDGKAIDGATGSRYYIKPDEDYYAEYYCKTDAGDSRKITFVNGNSGGGDILKEHFDGETFPPAGWTQTIKVSDNTWQKGNPADKPFTDIDPTNVYSAICPYVDQDQDEWLITPAVNLPSGTINLEFYAGYNSSWLSNATVKLNISTDGGATWTKLGEAENDGNGWEWRKITVDLSSYAGQSVKLAWQYVGNDGDLVAIDNVELTQGATGIGDNQAEIDHLLSQNYPNPFSGQTRIAFRLEHKANVHLTIFNSLGQKIAEPVSRTMNTGEHVVLFNAAGLQPGIYFYRIVMDGSVATKRMIIMK